MTVAVPPLGVARWTRGLVRLDETGRPGRFEGVALGIAVRVAEVVGRRSLSALEAARTVESFRLFRLAEGFPALSSSGSFDAKVLIDALDREEGRDRFAALWTAEGLGYRWAVGRSAADDVLGAGVTSDLPAGSLIPFHVGAALAITRNRWAIAAGDGQGVLDVEALLEDFETSMSPGCRGIGAEGLGLFVRTLLPEALEEIDEILARRSDDSRAWFWHGVGRALTFLFPRALYGEHAWARTVREASDERALRAVRSGVVWAICLLNLGDARVVAELLSRQPAVLEDGVFAHALLGTSLLWYAWAGRDRLEPWLELRGRAEPDWDDRVALPLARALEEVGPGLVERRSFEDLFLYPSRLWSSDLAPGGIAA